MAPPDAEHFPLFHLWAENFCFVFIVRVPFSNLSGIVWTGPKCIPFLLYLQERDILLEYGTKGVGSNGKQAVTE